MSGRPLVVRLTPAHTPSKCRPRPLGLSLVPSPALLYPPYTSKLNQTNQPTNQRPRLNAAAFQPFHLFFSSPTSMHARSRQWRCMLRPISSPPYRPPTSSPQPAQLFVSVFLACGVPAPPPCLPFPVGGRAVAAPPVCFQPAAWALAALPSAVCAPWALAALPSVCQSACLFGCDPSRPLQAHSSSVCLDSCGPTQRAWRRSTSFCARRSLTHALALTLTPLSLPPSVSPPQKASPPSSSTPSIIGPLARLVRPPLPVGSAARRAGTAGRRRQRCSALHAGAGAP